MSLCGLRCPAIALLVMAIGLAPARSPAAEPTIEELAAQLRETLTGLHSIEARYRKTYVVRETNQTYVNDCLWIIDGAREKLFEGPSKEGQPLPNEWLSFDGRFGYQVVMKGDFPAQINKSSIPPKRIKSMSVAACWLGLVLREFDGTLIDLLDRGTARVTGREDWNGLPAYKVDFGTHGTPLAGPWRYVAVLCPGRDGLPVEITAKFDADHPDAARHPQVASLSRAATNTYTVSEFLQANDAALGTVRWFPAKMKMRRDDSSASTDLEMQSVRINHPISAAIFAPPTPLPGTVVADESVPGKRTVTRHEDKKAMTARATALAREVGAATRASPTEHAVGTEQPNSRRLLYFFRWGGTGILVFAGVLFVFRSLRPR